MDKPSQISALLYNADTQAKGVMQRGQYLHRLDRWLGTLLDKDSRLHCRVGNISDERLILYADSTAWATRLRYQIPDLLQKLQQQKGLSALQRIEIKVLPKQEQAPNHHKAALSAEASSCLSACADSVGDGELRNALQRLAAHHNKRTSS